MNLCQRLLNLSSVVQGLLFVKAKTDVLLYHVLRFVGKIKACQKSNLEPLNDDGCLATYAPTDGAWFLR